MSYRDQATTTREGIISSARVRTIADPVDLPTSRVDESHDSDVELLRENGVVQAIRVTCTCGETLLLECSYDA